MKSTRIMMLGLLACLAGCGPTQQDLALQAQIKEQAQDDAARTELGVCNQKYPSPVSRENAVAKFQCMNTAYHHFSRKTDQIDEDYFSRNMALATRYADGEISYQDMVAGIAKNADDVTRQRTVLTYQAGMAQAEAADMAERIRAAKAARGAARDAAESDSPDAD